MHHVRRYRVEHRDRLGRARVENLFRFGDGAAADIEKIGGLSLRNAWCRNFDTIIFVNHFMRLALRGGVAGLHVR